ncbi:hypothetical protein LBBP_01795 [Leptospira borgpetersenii serovar Ballum]|uniref:Uncharacterized protein n=1 Tax=Leptospira borgpetersenii serovar Ballum TaxID=280505 RepID=A0A0S2IQZ0_LEPBO|nr:hypothetical protein LBBP_01795 [Leptospira borgpetersenii serovar Ballum]
MLKNSIIQINKTALIDRFHETETDEELIFQQLYYSLS